MSAILRRFSRKQLTSVQPSENSNVKEFNRKSWPVALIGFGPLTEERVEKTDVVHSELHSAEERAEALHGALQKTKQKVLECHRSKATAQDPDKVREKRKKKLVEYELYKCMLSELKNLQPDSILRQVMELYASALDKSVEELVEFEVGQENIIDKVNLWVDEENKTIKQLQTKLKNLALDMDGARSRLEKEERNNDEPMKVDQLRKEYDDSYIKMETCKDNLAFEVYTTAAKEIQAAKFFENLVQQQLEYHKAATAVYSEVLPKIAQSVANYPKRPAFGCPLEDHLRYTNRPISTVIEVCCTALLKKGMDEEGIFRISGNALKVKRLKAAFDAGEVDLIDCFHDPHAIASVLKSYLRELPDSLMTNYLFSDWLKASSLPDGPEKKAAVAALIQRLPQHNLDNLRFLMKFFSRLCQKTSVNKMDPKNCGIVLGPNLLWSPTAEPGSQGVQEASRLTEYLIINCDELFPEEVPFRMDLIANYARFVDEERSEKVNGDINKVTSGHKAAKAAVRPKNPAPPPPPSSRNFGSATSQLAIAPIATMEEHDDESADWDAKLPSPPIRDSRSPPIGEVMSRSMDEVGLGRQGSAHSSRPSAPHIGWNVTAEDPPGGSLTNRSTKDRPTSPVKGHRKTASLDTVAKVTMQRPSVPPPAPVHPPTEESEDDSSESNPPKIIDVQKRHSAHIQGRVKDAKAPNRPPLPSRETLDRHSTLRASLTRPGDGDHPMPAVHGMATVPKAKPRKTKEQLPFPFTSDGEQKSVENVINQPAGGKPDQSKTTTITVNMRDSPSPTENAKGLVSNRKTMFDGGTEEKCPPDPPQTPPSKPKPPLPVKPGGITRL